MPLWEQTTGCSVLNTVSSHQRCNGPTAGHSWVHQPIWWHFRQMYLRKCKNTGGGGRNRERRAVRSRGREGRGGNNKKARAVRSVPHWIRNVPKGTVVCGATRSGRGKQPSTEFSLVCYPVPPWRDCAQPAAVTQQKEMSEVKVWRLGKWKRNLKLNLGKWEENCFSCKIKCLSFFLFCFPIL